MSLVSGTITFAPDIDTRPPIIVKAYDVDLISKQLLGQRTLGPFSASESFEITYTRRDFGADEGTGRADVKVEAISEDGLFAAESNIIFNAPEEVRNLRLVLRPVENPLSEFERLVDELTPLMQGVLPENLTTEQMAFLNRDTEGRLERIIAWHEAAVLTEATEIPVEAGYAWRRLNIQPLTVDHLLTEETPERLRRALTAGVNANVIPDITDQIDDILTRLNALRKRVVSGSITFDSPSNLDINEDIIVQAFDKDLRSEELLGETRIQLSSVIGVAAPTSGFYRIEYTEAQFEQDERETADLFVRARTASGGFTGESAIRFNAGEDERIDLVLTATSTLPPEEVDLSELEELQATLEPVRENIAYADFTDEDIQFLTRELMRRPVSRGEAMQIQQRLEFLRTADQLAQATLIPLAAFYGWFRQDLPTELDALLDTAIARLREALETAIEENIIPAIEEPIFNILEAIRGLRFEQGRLVSHRFVAQVIDAATDEALGGLNIEVLDLDAEAGEQNLGLVITDGQGIFVINFVLPGDAPEDATRALQLTIQDEERTLTTVEVAAVPNQTEVAEIYIDIPPTEQEQTSIQGVVSASLGDRLTSQGIETFSDILANPDLVDEADTDELDRLRALAKWTVLAHDLSEDERTYLIESDLRSLWGTSRISRAEFMNAHHEALGGDAAAYAFFKANRDTSVLMQHQISEAWIRQVTSPDDEDEEDPDIPTGVKETLDSFNKCGCKDCDSAVSPAAYLAHLLDWVLIHVKDNTGQIEFAELERDLHQPFGDLPASCEAVEEEVRQVRLVVETLWRFTGLRDQTDLQMPTSFRNAYRHLCNQLYKTILTNLGISFEQLRRATLPATGETSTDEIIASQRETIANILGIDESRLSELFFNVEQPPVSPSEDQLEQIFGYQSTRRDPFEAGSQPDLITWQRAKLQSIWQTQDWITDAYSEDNRLPFIDPVLIDESYLRTPLETNPAFLLLTSRQQAIANHRQTMAGSLPAEPTLADLETLLTNELGQSIDQLQALLTDLQSSESSAEMEEVSANIQALHLTVAGFTHLMDIHAQLVNGESLGTTEEEVDAVWETVLDILSRAHRHSLFEIWVEQENDDGILFSPKLFWLPIDPLDAPNPWQASQAERDAWGYALQQRSQRSIIDPDQIPQDYIRVLAVKDNLITVLPDLLTIQLWEDRREFIDTRLNNIQTARQGQPTGLDALQAMLVTSNTGLDVATLTNLRNVETQGQDINPRLAQLHLSMSAYRFLADILLLAETGRNISGDRWDAVAAILVQAEKQLEFAEWRIAEQNLGVTLHPDQFEVSSPPEDIIDSIASEWLHDPRALNQWIDILEARQDQFNTLDAALVTAVGNAEEQVLPLLRNILITQAAVPENIDASFEAKADWLDKRLLMDMQIDGCHMTTRVSHAIETLQRLVRGIYNSEHISQLQVLTLDAVEDYEAEWSVIGSYATWRAFMLAYLFPENLLHVSPPSKQSYGFTQLKKNLSDYPSAVDACEAATTYGNYFEDICNLEVQASCQVRTRRLIEAKCDATASSLESLVHVFALSSTSNRVYTATFNSYFDKKDTLSTWRPILTLNNVVEIIGAVPHTTPQGIRLILLFVKVRENSRNRLQFVKYDLDTATTLWENKPEPLGLPPGTDFDFSAVAVQKRHSNPGQIFTNDAAAGDSARRVPTMLAIRSPGGKVYVRSLNSNATNWAGDEWIPLFGSIHAENFSELCALIQLNQHEYVMIVGMRNSELRYRIFSTERVVSRDDGFWRKIGEGIFSGAFVWPQRSDVFVFYYSKSETNYSIINDLASLEPEDEGIEVKSVIELDRWLESVVGVSLRHFLGPFSAAGPQPDGGIFSVGGNLYSVLLDPNILDFLKDAALEQFKNKMELIDQASFQDRELGEWKLADLYTRQFASGKGIATIVEDAFNNEPTILNLRRANDAIQFIDIMTSQELNFISSGGDEEFEPNPKKALVLHNFNGAFRLKFRRLENDELSTSGLRKITLRNNGGLYDLAPVVSREELQTRRSEIRAVYQANKDAPPSLQIYLKEAYNLVPIYLGFSLQRAGDYEESLLWYRQVFDYLQSFGNRKIDYSLRKEEKLSLDYDTSEEFLDDSSNAHAIAATRKDSYSRQILLLIIRCLLDYADALFARDNVTDNARARELYTLALRLLDFRLLKPAKSQCENIFGQLEVEIVPSGEQFKAALATIQVPDRLEDIVGRLEAISQDTNRSTVTKLESMRGLVSEALAEIPPAKSQQAIRDTKQTVFRRLENQFLTSPQGRTLLQNAQQQRHQGQLNLLAEISGSPVEDLSELSLPWLRQQRFNNGDSELSVERLALTSINSDRPNRVAVLDQIRAAKPLTALSIAQSNGFGINSGISFDFCLPQNPVIQALRRRAENNLNKLRTCRNIAGFVRQIDPYGAPISIGSGIISPDGTIFSGIVNVPATPYPYRTLINRAKEWVNIAQQIESGYQVALENADREYLTVLQAEQSLDLARSRVVSSNLSLNQAFQSLNLQVLQRDSAIFRESMYDSFFASGIVVSERKLLKAYQNKVKSQDITRAVQFGLGVGKAIVGTVLSAFTQGQTASSAGSGGETAIALGPTVFGFEKSYDELKKMELELSIETREFEWRLQQGIAAQDIVIGQQQIQIAQTGIAIAQQERTITVLEQTHAAAILDFLRNRNFNEEMYRWIASVLADVYRYFLQEATAIARLAEQRLIFERLQPVKIIQSGYWNVPVDNSAQADNIDRLGLTGSARLLKDIYRLDQYAFETRQLKQSISITLDLAELFPIEFQRFRETGVLIFETPQSLIDRQFPGYYLCLIQQVTVSVVALVPPTYGIRASLISAGISQAVVGGDTFQTVTIRQLPERLALSAPTTTSSAVLSLEPEAQSLQRPFEGTGFATQWELRMPKASNPFDFNTMATVLFTIDLTALHSYDYEKQVIERLDRSISANRTFRFRNEFADQWYDLNNPDLTNAPMVVRFETRREDFPPNIDNLKIQHILLYFIRKDGFTVEIPVRHLQFTERDGIGTVGGGAQTIDGVISTRRGNGTSWLPAIGQAPFGEWELAFDDDPGGFVIDDVRRIRDLFEEELIEDILFVITYQGNTPEWPA